MSFRRSGHSDERRRRVLMDDASASAESAAAPAKPARERKATKGRNYFDAAQAANQPPVTVLIPARLWTLSVLLLSGLTLIALLNLLHAELPRLARWFGPEHVDSLNFAVRGNLAAWLSAALLGYAACMSVHIFNLRRHRVDDYKGRYRIWIPVIALLMFASIDAATGLHDATGGVIARYASKTGAFSATACWIALAALVAGAVALRMTIEMRRSLGSVASLLLALGFYAVAVAVRTGWLPIDPDIGWHTMVSATLLGHLLICFTTLAYAAHVYLDAQGLLKVKKPKEAKPKKKKEDAKGDEKPASSEKTVAGKQVRVDAAHGNDAGAKPAASSGGPLKAAISAATNKSPPASSASSAADQRRLSKAERKKLRRQGRDDDDDSDEDE